MPGGNEILNSEQAEKQFRAKKQRDIPGQKRHSNEWLKTDSDENRVLSGCS